jgi:hypothetical protein
MRNFCRFLELGLGITLVVVVCVTGLERDSKGFHIPMIKAQPGPWKVKAKFSEKSVTLSSSEHSYALNQLSIPYIQDPKIRKLAWGIYWCGTPTMSYLLANSRPTVGELEKNAVKLEANLRNVRRKN